jgi:hypothetical protein
MAVAPRILLRLVPLTLLLACGGDPADAVSAPENKVAAQAFSIDRTPWSAPVILIRSTRRSTSRDPRSRKMA